MAVKKQTPEELAAAEAAVTETTGNEVAIKEEDEVFEMASYAGIDLEDLGFSEEDLKALTGLDAIDSSEISIPYATLISKVTREHKVGDIVFPDGTVIHGADGETMTGISVMNIQPVRVYFPTPFNPKNSFICRSLDGKVGAPDGEFAGRTCASCEFSKYPETGGSSPCRDQRLLLCTREDGSLFHLQVGGVGVGVWKKFMSSQVFHLLPKARNILGALNVTVGIKMIDTDFGPFPALDFRSDKKKPFHDVSRLKESLTSLKSYQEFATEHAASAANQSRLQMAAGETDSEGTAGPNGEMF